MIAMLKDLLLPSTMCFVLAAAGLVLCISSRTRKAALVAFATAGSLLLVFSCGKTATFLLGSLEYAYPRAPDQPTAARAIVVLAGYAVNDPNMSLSDRSNSSTLYRVVEAAHLWQRCHECMVVVTGRSPTTLVMAELLMSLGVPRMRLALDNDADNTGASATNVRRLLGDTPFYLVTSAGHMPRSMATFVRAGADPIPAPTDHRLPNDVAQAAWSLSAFHLECSDLAIHEHLGAWWYRLRGRI